MQVFLINLSVLLFYDDEINPEVRDGGGSGDSS